MCGRFSLGTTDLKTEYNLTEDINLEPKFNISPGMQIPVVIWQEGKMKLVWMEWQFRFESKNKPDFTLINAKGETLFEKPMFKKLISTQRCLIPATGFYEWHRTEKQKIPYYIYLKNRKMFSFGGIYRKEVIETRENEEGKEEKVEKYSVVIITIEPNELMQTIHNRMPLIIDKRDEVNWLTYTEEKDINSLIAPYPTEEMNAYTVSKKVNFAGNDGKELIEEFRYELGV